MRHLNFTFWSRNFTLRHFYFAAELKKYFFRHFNFANFMNFKNASFRHDNKHRNNETSWVSVRNSSFFLFENLASNKAQAWANLISWRQGRAGNENFISRLGVWWALELALSAPKFISSNSDFIINLRSPKKTNIKNWVFYSLSEP